MIFFSVLFRLTAGDSDIAIEVAAKEEASNEHGRWLAAVGEIYGQRLTAYPLDR